MQRLPRLSTTVWLIIIVVLVAVVAVPMITSYTDETAKQAPLKDRLAKLQSQYADLQKQLGSQGSMTAQINALKADIVTVHAGYGHACDSIEMSKDLIDLAWQNDVTILSMASSSVKVKIQEKDYPGTSYIIRLSGQVPNFQNYLIDMGNKFASSRPADILIQPATKQGELDHAVLTINILCNE